jgi:lipopolysaccharide transport system ATP-binding protein
MSDVILSVENVSKLYRLGTVGTGTFGGDVQRFWKTKILGQEDPFLKIGQTNDRTSKEKAEFVWALQDINFEVKRGEVLGIIGKNGAGKSTLLKLLSRITSPTTGSIKSAGRMASLLEVGTGFHPELTGRENIFLNGAILGMTKKEIQSKFDEIVDFSGCELYIDTPTKRYSSGMTVRLGFAVAAFLDPEILVVDEVLAVGDAEFQEKAIGKMKDVSSSEGKTILFVSHNLTDNLTAIKNLCPNSLLLENGKFVERNSSDLIIERYLKNDINSVGIINWSLENYPEDKIFLIKSVKVFQASENIGINYIENETIIEIDYLLKNHHKRVSVSIGLKHGENIAFVAGSDEMEMDSGEYKTSFIIPACLLNDTKYTLSVVMVTNSNNWNIELIDILRLDFLEKKQRTSGYIGPIVGTVRPLILNKTIKRLE